MRNSPRKINPLIYISLISIPILWGTTFVSTKHLTQDYPIFFTTLVRHAIALLGFAPYFSKLKKMNGRIARGAAISGTYYFWAVILQTYGLQLTTSGIAGFVTALYIILIPIFLRLFWKRHIDRSVIHALLFSILGLFILFFNPRDFGISSNGASSSAEGNAHDFLHSPTMGVIFVFFAAILFAFQLIVMEKYLMGEEQTPEGTSNQPEQNKEVDPRLFAMTQLFTTCVLSLIFSPIFGERATLSQISREGWMLFIYLGLAGTTLPFLFQNIGQKYIPSDKTGIIFSTEPIFASLFGILIDHEPFYWQLVVGGALIMIGIVIVLRSEKKWERGNNDKKLLMETN